MSFWPWISRAEHEQVIAELKAAHRVTVDALAANTERLFASLDDAREKSHELAMPKAPIVYEPAEPVEADPITKVIREQAGRDPMLIAHFRKYVRELKQQGKTQDEIIGALVSWQTSELPS